MIVRLPQRRFGCCLSVAALRLCAVVVACGPERSPRKVRISVVVILASETDDKVDKKLECIAREAVKLHPKLKGFRLEKLSCKSLPVGKADNFTLVENQETSITVRRRPTRYCIQLTVGPPMMGRSPTRRRAASFCRSSRRCAGPAQGRKGDHRGARAAVPGEVSSTSSGAEKGGESGAADILRLVGSVGETARDLASRLYNTCERKKWAEEARADNGLVIA